LRPRRSPGRPARHDADKRSAAPAARQSAAAAEKFPLRRVTILLRFRKRLVTDAGMQMSWLNWSNPVAIWWVFLIAVSAVNMALLAGLHARYRKFAADWRTGEFAAEPLLLLSAVYVFGCAFRSVLPRADVQRICLFDTPFSSVLVGPCRRLARPRHALDRHA
jgi:hypothetical protein